MTLGKEFSIEWSPEMKIMQEWFKMKPKVVQGDIYKVTRNTLVDMHNEAFKRARFDTGFMRNNFFISLDSDMLGGKLWGDAEYTVYHEYGTQYMVARPAIRYGFMIYSKRYLDDLAKILEM